jgi:hypothetical protein
MGKLEEIAITKLTTASAVDMKTSGSVTLYTVPIDKSAYITNVIIRNTSASIAGGTDYGFTNWKQAIDLSSLSASGLDYIVLDGNNTKFTKLSAGTPFQIAINVGASGSYTATIDVFGYLV